MAGLASCRHALPGEGDAGWLPTTLASLKVQHAACPDDTAGTIKASILSCRLACLPEPMLHVPALFQVCREGQVLDAHQAAILRVFGIKMATFKLRLLAAWHAEGVHYVV